MSLMISLKSLTFLTLSILSISCSPTKADFIHKKKINNFAKVIKQVPPKDQKIDSLDLNKQHWVETTNFSMLKPNFVMIHHTALGTIGEVFDMFTSEEKQVSSHYVIDRNGDITQMLNTYLRAHHAGLGKWGNTTDMNSCSIGIEIVNTGTEPFTETQIESLLKTLETLKKTYNIPTANFIGHADFAPTRKEDPSIFFPWKILADKGFGLWYEEILENAPANFNPKHALRIIGYDVTNLEAAIVAFKRHFIQNDLSPILTDNDIKILYNLFQKYM